MKNQKQNNYNLIKQEIRTLLEEHLNKNRSDLLDDIEELVNLLKPYQKHPRILQAYSNFLEAQINRDDNITKESLDQLIELLDQYYQDKLSSEHNQNQIDILVNPKQELKTEAQNMTDRKLNILLDQHYWQESDLENPDTWVRMTKISRREDM